MSTLAPFPADDPIWNTGGTNRITPTGAKQILGYALGEEPPSGHDNWFQFYVGEYVQHYKVAVVALNNGKLDRNGNNTITGTILVDLDDTHDLGGSTERFQNIYGSNVHVYADLDMESGSFVDGALIPKTSLTHDLGSSSFRWDDLFTDGINTNTIVINTSALPDAAGGAVLGSNAAAWSDVVTQSLRANAVISYADDEHPNNQLALIGGDQNKVTLAIAHSTGGSPGTFTNVFNCASRTNPSPGVYVYTFDQPIDDLAGIALTLLNGAAAGIAHTAEIAAGGATVEVRIYVQTAVAMPLVWTPTNVGHTITITGRPDTKTTTPIV